jgi:hypothetical protein
MGGALRVLCCLRSAILRIATIFCICGIVIVSVLWIDGLYKTSEGMRLGGISRSDYSIVLWNCPGRMAGCLEWWVVRYRPGLEPAWSPSTNWMLRLEINRRLQPLEQDGVPYAAGSLVHRPKVLHNGFGFYSYSEPVRDPLLAEEDSTESKGEVFASVPHWFVIAVFAIVPACRLIISCRRAVAGGLQKRTQGLATRSRWLALRLSVASCCLTTIVWIESYWRAISFSQTSLPVGSWIEPDCNYAYRTRIGIAVDHGDLIIHRCKYADWTLDTWKSDLHGDQLDYEFELTPAFLLWIGSRSTQLGIPGFYRISWQIKSTKNNSADTGVSRPLVLQDSGTALAMPVWIPAILFAIAPTYRLIVLRRRRIVERRRAMGLCLNCGYDLRASGDRCPECGSANEGVITGIPVPR